MTTSRRHRRTRSPKKPPKLRRDERQATATDVPEEAERAPYGTVDGDALVRGWLAQMGDKREARSRSRHQHDESRQGDKPEIPASGRKRKRSASLPPSPRQPSSPVQEDAAAQSRYEKRPRHKTREDRYEPRNDPPDRPVTRTIEKKGQHRRRTEEPVRKRLATARDVIENFAPDSILKDRLTLQPATTPGLFQNGHASGTKQPADLAFNSMNFLSRPRERKPARQPKDTGKKEREVQELSAFFRGEHELVRRQSGERPGSRGRINTPASGPEAGRGHESATPVRSPVTTYMSCYPSVAREDQRDGDHRGLGHGQAEPHRSRRVAHPDITAKETHEAHEDKPKYQRQISLPSSRRHIIRYQDKGVMALESEILSDGGPNKAQSMLINTQNERTESREKTNAPAQSDQACQVDAETSITKQPVVDQMEGDTSGDAHDPANQVDAGPESTTAAEDTEKLPPTRSSSPEYIESLKKVVSGKTTSQSARSRAHPATQGMPPGEAAEQRSCIAAPNSDQQMPLPDVQDKPQAAASSTSDTWIAHGEARLEPQAGLAYDFGAFGPQAYYQEHAMHTMHPEQPQYHQYDTTNSLISRVDRELARDAAVERLSRQMNREEADYHHYAAATLEQDDWDESFIHHYGEDMGGQDLQGHEQYQWTDGLVVAALDQPETGGASTFWRPNMFM